MLKIPTDLRNVHFSALWNTLPTQFALLFFNILHPPLNVPALGRLTPYPLVYH